MQRREEKEEENLTNKMYINNIKKPIQIILSIEGCVNNDTVNEREVKKKKPPEKWFKSQNTNQMKCLTFLSFPFPTELF